MAGVGITENRIYPKDSFGLQLFTHNEVQSQSVDDGGIGSSRMRSQGDIEKRRFHTQERLTLDDVRWSDMRKKVPGMGRVPQSKIMEIDNDEYFQEQKREHLTYIRQHFEQLECQIFIPAPNQTSVDRMELVKCQCGEILKGHVPYERTPHMQPNFGQLIPTELKPYIDLSKLSAKPPERFPEQQWKAADALKNRPTTSFGKIKFTGVEQVGGMKPAKYLRLRDVENPDVVDKVIYLMKEHWRIMEPKTPSLIISVVGGAKNFKLSGKMRETFQSGLIKASKTTNAWLITSGFNMGCMKEVGLAVREGQSFEWYQDRYAHVLRCIGIAPWGYVKNRHILTDNSTSLSNVQGKFDKMAEYKTSNIIEHLKPVPLNSDHTHFIFVDNGLRNVYKGVAEFRARFEKKLSDPVDKGGEGIPVVLIVLEGGRDAIEDAKTSLGQNIPVILCEGTGRAADILVTAYNLGDVESKTFMTKIKKAIKKAYFELKPADKDNEKAKKKAHEGIESVFESVKKCMEKKNLISIFHINKHEELDNEILKILLKAKTGEATQEQRLERLMLALKWDRADIAQEEIFREDALWSRGSFNEALQSAIMNDNVKFVQIILNQGVVMREYLTDRRLLKLYKMAVEEKNINNMPMKKVMARMSINEISRDSLTKIVVRLMDKYEFDVLESVNEQKVDGDEEVQFKYPYKHLLIWSVLLLRQNMANFAVKMGGEPVTSSVAASRLNYSLARYIHRNEQAIKNKVLNNKTEFDDLASEVIDECHNHDPNKAMMIAERRSPMWSNMTSMQMAASADNQTFLASVVCQNSISTIWKRGIESSWQCVFMVSMLPFLAPTPVLEIDKLGDRKISGGQKFLTFVTSPIAKFTYHSMMYLTFLMLFTYFVLVEFRKDYVTPIEILCIFWIFTFIIDNIHTCLAFPSPTLKGTLRDWFGLLKFLDQLNCVLALCAFFIHYEGTYYRQAKAIFCINTVIFYIRLLEVYTVNSRLGPKMVMIKRMMVELVMFILVLMIFLLAYGVVSQGLLYLERKRDWEILKDVIYFPYWQFYGELFLDEIDDDDACMAKATNGTTMPNELSDCRTFHWLVPIFLAAYLLIGNVLLLNLLIAIFSNVFHEVEVNSNRIWKYQMYLLVMEFDTKAAMVPPFSIFIHIYLIFKWIFRKTCCKKSKEGRQYGSRHLEYLQLFEKEQLSNYLRKKKADERNATDINILAMQKRVDELYKLVKEDTLEKEVQEEAGHGKVRPDSLYGTGFQATLKTTDQSAATKDEASDKEEKKEKKRKKKKKKKDRDNVEKEINIDKDIQKPEMEKKVPTWASDPHIGSLAGLPPHTGTPLSSRRKPTLLTWNDDSDSDDDDNRRQPAIAFNIRHDSESSDLNNFDRRKHRRSKVRQQDSVSEEDYHRKSSKIRQKLRKKRSSNQHDSDS